MDNGNKFHHEVFRIFVLEGPVVQRIVCRFPEPEIGVRSPAGLLFNFGIWNGDFRFFQFWILEFGLYVLDWGLRISDFGFFNL